MSVQSPNDVDQSLYSSKVSVTVSAGGVTGADQVRATLPEAEVAARSSTTGVRTGVTVTAFTSVALSAALTSSA